MDFIKVAFNSRHKKFVIKFINCFAIYLFQISIIRPKNWFFFCKLLLILVLLIFYRYFTIISPLSFIVVLPHVIFKVIEIIIKVIFVTRIHIISFVIILFIF